MLIGKRGAATTSISTAAADRVTVRGRDLCADLMGATNFTEFFFLLATGRTPTADQSFFLDLALVALAEHGLTPSVQAARMTYAADPAALQGAVAAGVLGCGTVILGAAREARALLDAGAATDRRRRDARRSGRCDRARASRGEASRSPAYGHPLHKPVDPRAERMIALARQRGTSPAAASTRRRGSPPPRRAYGGSRCR